MLKIPIEYYPNLCLLTYISDFTNSHLFPRPLGEFIKSYGIKEMHISLTEGVWRHKSWGYPIVEAGPGAELWVWFKNGTEK